MRYLDFSVSIGKLYIDAKTVYINNPDSLTQIALRPHDHVLHELYFIEEGDLSVQCDDDLLRLGSHDILLINHHVTHQVISFTPTLKRLSVRFSLADMINMPPYTLIQLDENTQSIVATQIKLIRRYYESPDTEMDFFRAQTAFSILLSYIIDATIPLSAIHNLPTPSHPHNRMDYGVLIDNFFHDYYSKHVTIADLAKFLGYSKSSTNRILYEYSGLSFNEKLSVTRIQVARNLLSNTKLSVDTIAEQCGYQSRRGFESMFRKKMGISPHQCRVNSQLKNEP